MKLTCQYCGNEPRIVDGSVIYPHIPSLKAKPFYLCDECDAYCGCHPGTTKPLGSLANAELRAARRATHAMFDPLWKSRRMSRTEAYRWLAKRLAIPASECHVGMFDLERCQKAQEAIAGMEVPA